MTYSQGLAPVLGLAVEQQGFLMHVPKFQDPYGRTWDGDPEFAGIFVRIYCIHGRRDHVGLSHDMVNKFRDGKILYPPAVKVEPHLPRFRNWEFASAIFGYLRGSKDGHLLGGFPDF